MKKSLIKVEKLLFLILTDNLKIQLGVVSNQNLTNSAIKNIIKNTIFSAKEDNNDYHS